MMKWPSVKLCLLFWAILFAVLFIMGEIIDLGVRKSNYSHYYKINLLANKRADPEIAVFGSSVGEVGIDPRVIENITGKRTYNYSIDGTRFLQYRGLVKELNESSASCKLVIFTETFFSLTKVDQLTEADRYMAHIRNNSIYESLYDVQPELAWKLKYIPFYKFVVMKHPYYKASILGLKSWIKNILPDDSLKGYTPKYRTWETGLDSINKSSKPVTIILDSITIEKYRLTIRELKHKGRKVLIIIPPVHKDGLALLPNLDVLRKALSSFEEEGVYFRDYSVNGISEDKSYFYNNSHLNDAGAKKFSGLLAGDINKLLREGGQ
ncbi:MAG: hypothetical protein SFU87_00960 [Chitinophagaceae bacterium]|nr:hypothetical protein [Chitinophagaceae bacterium]